MLRRLLSAVLTAAMVMSLFIGIVPSAYADDVNEIYTVADLYAINNDMAGSYILMKDLDLSEATSSGGAYDYNNGGWDPIGYNHTDTVTQFTGTFDGNGHKISGLKIDSTRYDTGLFGVIGNIGTVKSLSVSGTVTCKGNCSGLISGENKGTIDNCISEGEVEGISHAGGIAGLNYGNITNCHNNCNISSPSCSGGITAANSGNIENSSNSGNICTSGLEVSDFTVKYTKSGVSNGSLTVNKSLEGAYGGGIAGKNMGGISECFNNGDVSTALKIMPNIEFVYSEATSSVVTAYTREINFTTKGFCGGIAGANTGGISNSYNSGKICSNDKMGAVCSDSSASTTYQDKTTKQYILNYKFNSYRGGIAGLAEGSYGQGGGIGKCYNVGEVSCNDRYYSVSGKVIEINDEYSKNYGIAATSGGSGCSYSYTVSGELCTGSSTLSDEGMKLASSFGDWDFEDTWTINSNYEYPYPQLKSNVQSTDKTIDSVVWRNTPTKVKYYKGEDIDLSGGSIRVYYVDGTSKVITLTESMISGFDSLTEGTQTLTVEYEGNTLEYQVDIEEEPEIASVEELSGPDKTEFVKGTELDFAGWAIQVNYTDDTSKIIKVTADKTTGVDITKTGKYCAEYTYGEYKFQKDITIIPVLISGIKIKKVPNKTEYILGEEISLDGLKVAIQYNDGTSEVSTDYTLGSYETDKIGTQEVTVSCSDGENTYTDSFNLTIEKGTAVKLNITSQPTKKQYVEGEKFDSAGMVVEAEYSNGVVLPITDYTCTEIGESLGEQNITVSYQDVTADVTVTVIERKLQSISLSHLPNKTQYTQGQDTDATGLVITGTYNDGSKEKIEGYTLSGFNTNTLGTHTVVATYKGYSVDFTIKVVEAESTSIFVEDDAVKKSYLEGEELDLTGLVVKAKYNNGKSKVIEGYEVNGFTGEVGLNNVTISFEGLECIIPMYVHVASGKWIVTEEPSCTKVGKRIQYCTECGEIAITEEIDTLEHDFGEWVVVEDSTCSKEGYKTRTCETCKYVETKGIDKAEHDWESDYTIDSVATCILDGSKSIHCKDCDAVKDSTVIRATGHDYTDWVTDKEATCTEGGYATRTCKTCDAEESINLPATGHKWESDPTVDKKPTCTETGSQSIHCKHCDAVKEGSTEEIEATGHSYGSWETTKEPTCTEKGSKERICSKCEHKETAEIEATGHKWESDPTVDKKPTCTETGSQSIHCKHCDAVKEGSTEEIEATGHSYGSWETTKEPTCTEKGSKERICSKCEHKETAEIDATGHKWESDPTVDKKPTCTEKGSQSIHCKHCDAIKEGSTEEIEATGHSYGSWETTKEPTCTEKGSKERICSKCEHKETAEIEATGHKWESDPTIDKKPTCTEKGSQSIHCKHCDAVKEGSTEEIEATGHSYGSWETTKEPTCTEKGLKERICSKCEHKETAEIDATGHKWESDPTIDKKPTCTEKGSQSIHCKHCDAVKEGSTEEIEATVHSYGSWETTKEPTCTEKGSKERICSKCEHKETAEIEATGHKYKEFVVEPTCSQKGYTLHVCRYCGDSYKDTETEKAGHSFGEWQTIRDSSCAEHGFQQRECSECGLIQSKDMDKTEHQWESDYTIDSQVSCTVDGSKSIHCKNCDAVKGSTVIKAQGHQFSDWEQTAKATCVDKGCFERECTVCHETEKMWTMANGHTYQHVVKATEVGVAGKEYDECTECGDIINEVDIPALSAPKTAITKLSAASKAFTAYWTKKTGITGYQLRYSLKSSMSGSKTVTIKGATASSKKITKLSKKKYYYVQVQTYRTVTGKTHYSGWSATKKVKTK